MADINITLKQADRLIVTPEVVTPPVNIPPIVSAGSDKTIKLPVNKVLLVGAVSDPDGLASGLKVLWTKTSTLAGTISTPNAISTEVINMVEGVYVFKLTATDPKGGVTSDDITVTVLKADPVPVPGKVNYMTLPLSGPLDYSGRSNQIIENKRITNAGDVAVKLYNGANNIIIRNCFFDGGVKELVELENASNITIENCLFARGLAGVYAVASRNIIIRNCQFINMRIRRKSDGSFDGRGVFIQMNSSSDIQITDIKGENFAGESDAEDMISFFKSSNGLVKNVMVRGCATSTTSTSGGGIIIGDNGGDNVTVDGATLLTPGQYGCAVAGGTNMKLLNLKIYSEKNAVSNNPLYVWNQNRDSSNNLIPMANITVRGNRVHWIDKNGAVNNGWNAGNGTNIIFESPTDITLAEMNVPAHLIDFVTPTELLTIRK